MLAAGCLCSESALARSRNDVWEAATDELQHLLEETSVLSQFGTESLAVLLDVNTATVCPVVGIIQYFDIVLVCFPPRINALTVLNIATVAVSS